MTRRTTGTLLLLASALLYCTRYLSAAIYGSSAQGWNADLFNVMLEYVGPGLTIWSRWALIAGIVYLIWAELSTIFAPKKSSNDL